MATWYVNKSGWNATRVFTVSGITITPTAGATYTNNAITFTVVGFTGSAGTGYLFCTGSGAPTSSGTLTKASGTGDSTITFSAYQLGGSSTTAAYKTIQSGLGLCSSGDTLYVGSGNYNETISISNISLNIYADGVVNMDGSGLGMVTPLYYYSSVNGTILNFGSSSPNSGCWFFRNYTVNSTNGTVCLYANPSSYGAAYVNLTNVYLFGNTNNINGVFVSHGNQSTGQISLTRCIVANYSNNGVWCYYPAVSSSSAAYIFSSTFYNCGTALKVDNLTYCRVSSTYSIYHTCTYGFVYPASPAGNYFGDFDVFYNVTHLVNYSTTNVDTLAGVQALGAETHGSVSDPGLVDPANGVFYITTNSSYGAFPYSALTRGAGYNPDAKWVITGTIDGSGPGSGWYCSDGSVTKNGTTGFFELSGAGPTGVIWSPVFDLGSAQYVTQVNLAALQTWSTNMVDTTKTDSKPNYQTIEIRGSLNSFNQNDGSLTWTEIKSNMSFSGIPARYIQVKLTLRNDDIGA